MAPQDCLHPNRVRGVVALDFSRLEAPDHPFTQGRSQLPFVKSADMSKYTRSFTARSAIG
jgi:hypothetical protein